jgi:hypothetical protein
MPEIGDPRHPSSLKLRKIPLTIPLLPPHPPNEILHTFEVSSTLEVALIVHKDEPETLPT